MKLSNRAMPLERHRSLGTSLRKVQDSLCSLDVELSNTYGAKSKVARRAARVYKALSALRCELDRLLCTEHRELDYQELSNVYYGRAGRETGE